MKDVRRGWGRGVSRWAARRPESRPAGGTWGCWVAVDRGRTWAGRRGRPAAEAGRQAGAAGAARAPARTGGSMWWCWCGSSKAGGGGGGCMGRVDMARAAGEEGAECGEGGVGEGESWGGGAT
ncbi:formin-like protein [Gracilaria domingensis]|nr:formin-like protein [Gracilaria domingensis]